MQFEAFATNVEVNGETVWSIVDGMGAFRQTALNILAEHGIVDPRPGQWYSQQSWLEAFRTISDRVGGNTLYAIGRKIPENAQFPPQITDIRAALRSIDVAYHMNHRRGGEVLFDPATGRMLEGIGHYRYEEADERRLRVIGVNPYPCEFDRGIVTAVAGRFRPAGVPFLDVVHRDDQPCRRRKGESCTYEVAW
ncbi:MAG TPA: hypothetical protein VMT70_23030 [Vicinamibacteria bacterium]|nr:hypothetical protein [Vicinamibacteria bacterium]